ncbi:membrane-associated protein [Benzoatithermus flavus]|uniref:Membrane-associated protein n=1 Tax=Benzoatithermus flavus TaxID=3108223 RepID=A0ABU8XYP5_9PROT
MFEPSSHRRAPPGSASSFGRDEALRPDRAPSRVPLAPKLAWTGFAAVLVPTYWQAYGSSNFLWFSDIGLFLAGGALWLESPLLASTAAVGVLALELGWNLDFLAGGRLLGLAGYMFDSRKPAYLRALSLFHMALPPLLAWLLRRLGYDRRALVTQTALAWLVLPATYFFTDPEENINWVFGPGKAPQNVVPGPVYLGALMLGLPALVFLPTHLVLRKLMQPAHISSG